MRRGRLWRRKRERQLQAYYRRRPGNEIVNSEIQVGLFDWKDAEVDEMLDVVAEVVYTYAEKHGLPTPFVGAGPIDMEELLS